MAEKENVYQITGERVNEILKDNNIRQAELARMIWGPDCSPDNRSFICRIVRGKQKLTQNIAEKIIEAFPGKGYRISWLLGYDGFKTEREMALAPFEKLEAEVDIAFNNQGAICASVADMMKIYGMNWDGIAFRKSQTNGKHLVTCQGVQFEPWELARIANKVYQFLQMELDFAIETKRIQGTQEEC